MRMGVSGYKTRTCLARRYFRRKAMELIVTVSEDLSLNAGAVSVYADTLCIHSPERSLFDQLCAWLDQCPRPTTGFNHWVLGIGATALCLRWGTYLADTVLIAYAHPGSSTEQLAKEVLGWGKPVRTLHHESTAPLRAIGVALFEE